MILYLKTVQQLEPFSTDFDASDSLIHGISPGTEKKAPVQRKNASLLSEFSNWKHFQPSVYQHAVGPVSLFIVTNGTDDRFGVSQVGTGPSATTVLTAVNALSPHLVINAGTAGGFARSGGEVGDVYLGGGAVFHDHRIPLPAYDLYGRGLYPVLETHHIGPALRLKEGLVSTGGSLDCAPEDAKQLLLLGASVKDMEAAEVARVAQTLGLPFLTLKAITDLVDETSAKTQDQFVANFQSATSALTERLLGLIDFIWRNPEPRLEDL